METTTQKRGRPPRNKEVKTNLRELREAVGLSQEKLAEMLDVGQSAMSKAEREGRGISMAKWLMVSRIVKADLTSIFRA